MSEPFAVTVNIMAGEVILELAGDLDGSAGSALSAAWAEAARQDASRVVLDFGRIGYMNSTGIALVVELLGRARAARRLLAARGLTPHYRQIFEITRLTDFIAIEDAAPAGGQPASLPATADVPA